MTDLYENLPALEAAAHETGPLLDRLLAHGEASERAASELLEQVGERRREVDELERDVAAALEVLAQATEAGQARVDHGVEEAATAADGWRGELRESQGETGRAATSASDALDRLEDAMSASGTEVGEAEDRTSAAVAGLDEDMRERERALGEAVAGAVASAQGLETAAGRAHARADAAAALLRTAFQQLVEVARARLQQTIEHIRNTSDEQVAFADQLRAALCAEVESTAAAATARGEADIASLANAAEPTADALRSLADALAAAAENAENDALSVCEMYRVLSNQVDPLLAGVAAVREAASRVGVGWP